MLQLLAAGSVWDGVTVFQGDKPEPFQAEVLDILPQGVGPRVPMVLVRLRGERIEHTGVIAGMSGSPVYKDGVLMGAVGYRIGAFSREPIGGITPIEAMRAAAKGTITTAHSARASEAISVPLVVSGLDANASEPLVAALDKLSPVSLRSAAGGGAGGEVPRRLVNGGAIAVVMAHGDVNVFGLGTVTEVNDDGFIAFGHPMFGWGQVELPVATAWVSATIPSPYNAFKIGRLGKLVGTMTQDRLPAIAGKVGPTPKMLAMRATAGQERPLNVELVKHRQITPWLVAAVGRQALTHRINSEAGGTVQLKVRMQTSQGEIAYDDWAVHPSSEHLTASLVSPLSSVVGLLMDNPIAAIDLRNIDIKLEHRPTLHHEQLRALELLTPRPRVGSPAELRLRWRSYQGGDRSQRVKLPLPATTEAGEAEVVVAAGRAINTIEHLCGDAAEPSSAHEIVPWINGFADATDRAVFLIRRDRTDRSGRRRALASAWSSALPRVDLDAGKGFCRILTRMPLPAGSIPASGELAQPIELRGAQQ